MDGSAPPTHPLQAPGSSPSRSVVNLPPQDIVFLDEEEISDRRAKRKADMELLEIQKRAALAQERSAAAQEKAAAAMQRAMEMQMAYYRLKIKQLECGNDTRSNK